MRRFNTSLAVGVLLAGMAHAQATVSTQHVDSPFSGVFSSGCSEDIAVSGMVHGVLQLTRNDNTINLVSIVGPRGDAKAVGMDSGTRFNVVGSTFTRVQFSPNVAQNFTYHNTFKVIGLYTVKYDFHLLYGDDLNTPKAFVDNFTVTCD